MDRISCLFNFNFFFLDCVYDHFSRRYPILNEKGSFCLQPSISQQPMIVQEIERQFRKLEQICYEILSKHLRKKNSTHNIDLKTVEKIGFFPCFGKSTASSQILMRRLRSLGIFTPQCTPNRPVKRQIDPSSDFFFPD